MHALRTNEFKDGRNIINYEIYYYDRPATLMNNNEMSYDQTKRSAKI